MSSADHIRYGAAVQCDTNSFILSGGFVYKDMFFSGMILLERQAPRCVRPPKAYFMEAGLLVGTKLNSDNVR